MKLIKFALTPPVAAFSVALFAALSSFGGSQPAKFVEYVETAGNGNSGTQWLRLDYTPSSKATIEFEAALAKNKNATHTFFCARGDLKVNTFTLFWLANQGLRWDYANANGSKYGAKTLEPESKFSVKVNGGEFFYDDVKDSNLSYATSTFAVGGRLMLFASYTTDDSAPTGNFAAIRLYSFKVTDGGKTVCDLRPCVDEGGVAGLYDMVSQKVLYSMGTDAFAASETEVPWPFAVDTLTVTAVPGEYGSAVSPAYGTAPVEAGEVVCTAPTGEQTDSEDLRYTFTGWELTTKHLGIGDAVVTSGEGTACRYIHAAGDVDTLSWKIVKTPLLNVKRVAQRYPWNGLVDIDYVVSGLTGDPTDYRLEVTAHAGGRDIPCRHFTADSAGDLPVADGLHHIVWDASKDAPDLKADDVTVTLDLQYAPITETMADYIIIDLSAGPTATAFPVRFVKGDIPATAYNNPTYKTTKLVMKKVKAGVYTVGDNYINSDATTGELVKRSVVRLTHDYFLGIFEVTQKQYELVTGKKPSGCTIPNDKVAEDEIGMRPNEQVVWNNLMINLPTFASLLNEKTRYRTHALANFSLPTETQWEVACRAGALTAYYWGKDETNAADYEWFGDGQTGISRDHQTEVVGGRKPNGWGFYDMLGNVTEFCSDYNYIYPQGTEEEPAVDPHGPESGLSVIVRGSNFQTVLRNCGSRTDVAPDSGITYSGHMYGFRIAKTCP